MSHVARRTKYVVYINQFLERLVKYDKVFNKESFQMMIFGKQFGQKSAEAMTVDRTILAWILVYKIFQRFAEKRKAIPGTPMSSLVTPLMIIYLTRACRYVKL